MAKDIKLDESILKKNKIPVLIKDKEWKTLFSDILTRNMKKLVNKLEKLLEEERECKIKLKEYKKQKKAYMDLILKLSDEANSKNNERALMQLEEAKNKILEINDFIDEIQFRLETLPKEIDKTNFELLKETVIISYDYIREGRERLEYLNEEIQRIRKLLGNMWEEKFTKEKKINNLYLYLHGTLGHEEIDRLDRKYL
ncbi:hypothetical protein SAMN02745883_01481 [Caminicella sporogenes DSM 14501]|uniref:Uncharacterized protein n=1 Tax=Caminicella sporogenes DSM 14501 TaxID=1121266 RepID=A0A1M6QFY5_9FIRM|nr:hypothetical protein [Caminicella sporogenes]RKD25331.1 hypothetical protein BET04_03720 [Caminicella sporogenes]SHK19020.1 hypothetical protein SAMN02745883_01481 [Caminicella sporogenes DSM 14501]